MSTGIIRPTYSGLVAALFGNGEEQVFVSPEEELHTTPLNMFPEDFFPSTSLPLNEIL